MEKSEDMGSPSWSASLFMQKTEDVARAVAAAATAVRSPRPSVVYSSKDDSGGSQLQKLQRQFAKVMQGFSSPPPDKSVTYNPEVLTSQKRQWASFQSQCLEHRSLKEPERLFESFVVVGLHPNCDIQALQRQYVGRKLEGSGRLRSPLGRHNQSRVEPNLEPQVLFVYPPERELPLKQKALLSFCFPVGMEIIAIERTPSMSELNEILLGQERLKQSDLSFVFRLKAADDSTLFGCCVLVEELVQKPFGLLSFLSDKENSHSSLSRHILTTRRCYCILSRLPFFELHFSVLNSIFTEERLERLTRGINILNLDFLESKSDEENLTEDADEITREERHVEECDGTEEVSRRLTDDETHVEHQLLDVDPHLLKKRVSDNFALPIDPETETITARQKHSLASTVLPLLRYSQYESSESSSSFQGSPSEDRNFRSDIDDTEGEEASFSGQEDCSDLTGILAWAKANNHGSLQILCNYYRLGIPSRGSILKFHPLEHLLPVEYQRSYETALHLAGSSISLSSCSTSFQLAEAKSVLSADEEATALSTWTVACMCGSLRLEHILTIFAGALLEKQIAFVCSNLGILSASVLSIIPLIRPYQWQSVLMPILPNDMLEFLDAPVPYIMGVKNKPNDAQSKLSNVILVDATKNQVKAPSLPQLPKHKELLASLSPYHAKLVGESYLGRKRPVYECTDMQVEAAKGFLAELRRYLDSLCFNLRSHTITNVQSNDDKVSLLLKESFIDSFPYRDQPFMKQFVDTQMFSVHTDLVLSFFQKE